MDNVMKGILVVEDIIIGSDINVHVDRDKKI